MATSVIVAINDLDMCKFVGSITGKAIDVRPNPSAFV